MKEFKTSAIILAGGVGSRMNSDKTKQFMDILGKTVLERTVAAFDKSDMIDEIVIVVKSDELRTISEVINPFDFNKQLTFTRGGTCRAESARNGFIACSEDSDFVAIHDAARCLITSQMIDKVVKNAHIYGAASAVCSINDTVKFVDESGKITSTIPRDFVYRAQTPQVFGRQLYSQALDNCTDLSEITDDNMLVEKIGADIYAVDLGSTNIKITTRDDLTLARNILIERGEAAMNSFRIGHGYDVHKFATGRRLVIGGVDIPNDKGLLGHSDADVLLHALMDSLLGAAGLGDIGRHFPDTAEEYRGISSMHLLTQVMNLIRKSGYKVGNVDATVILQKPKIATYVPRMVSNIAFALGVPESFVNIKATTEEQLGFTGREEGASAHCVAVLICE